MLGLFVRDFSSTKNVRGAVIGVLLGLLVILWLSVSDFLFGPDTIALRLHTYLTIVIGTLIIFLTGFLIGLFRHKK